MSLSWVRSNNCSPKASSHKFDMQRKRTTDLHAIMKVWRRRRRRSTGTSPWSISPDLFRPAEAHSPKWPRPESEWSRASMSNSRMMIWCILDSLLIRCCAIEDSILELSIHDLHYSSCCILTTDVQSVSLARAWLQLNPITNKLLLTIFSETARTLSTKLAEMDQTSWSDSHELQPREEARVSSLFVCLCMHPWSCLQHECDQSRLLLLLLFPYVPAGAGEFKQLASAGEYNERHFCIAQNR